MPTINVRRRIVPPTTFVLPVESQDGNFELTLNLHLDLNAFCLIEEKTGIPMPGGIKELFDTPSLKNITVILWAALQQYHASDFAGDNGLQLIRSLLTFDGLGVAFKACMAAFVAQLPDAQRKAAEEKAAAEAKGEKPAPLAVSPAATA